MKALHQIEITSRCNKACPYCIHPVMKREKQDMDEEVYSQAIKWAVQFQEQYNQEELNLAGIGESILHHYFIDYIKIARQALPTMRIVLATNGSIMTKTLADAMAEHNILAWVTIHDMAEATKAIKMLKERHIFIGTSDHPATASMNWAGQVDWPVTIERSPCAWKHFGWLFVASNGDVLRCCQDGSDDSKIGTVWDDLDKLQPQRYNLCDSCVWEY